MPSSPRTLQKSRSRGIKTPLTEHAEPAPLAPATVALAETAGTVPHCAPQLGEHTGAILAEPGYSANDIETLRAEHVIWASVHAHFKGTQGLNTRACSSP